MPGAVRPRLARRCAIAALALCAPRAYAGELGPVSDAPELLAAQYTLIEQRQSALTSPYQGPLSLHPDGDRQATHTI